MLRSVFIAKPTVASKGCQTKLSISELREVVTEIQPRANYETHAQLDNETMEDEDDDVFEKEVKMQRSISVEEMKQVQQIENLINNNEGFHKILKMKMKDNEQGRKIKIKFNQGKFEWMKADGNERNTGRPTKLAKQMLKNSNCFPMRNANLIKIPKDVGIPMSVFLPNRESPVTNRKKHSPNKFNNDMMP